MHVSKLGKIKMRIERKNFFMYREAIASLAQVHLGADEATASRQSVFAQSATFYSLRFNFLQGRYYRWFCITADQLVSEMVDASNLRGITSRFNGRTRFAGIPSLRSAPLSFVHYALSGGTHV